MRATEQSEEEMAKAIGYIVMELENTGCAITAEAINTRLNYARRVKGVCKNGSAPAIPNQV
jgi:hypothetical protein